MRKNYDFSNSIKNPYAKALKGQKIVVRIVRRHRAAKSSRVKSAITTKA